MLNSLEPFTTARELWVLLETYYGTITNEQILTLMGELHDFKLNGGEQMHHFFNRFNELVNRLTFAKQRPSPIQLLNHMLRAFPETVFATQMFFPGLTMKILRANLLKVEQLSAKGVLEGHALVARGGGRPSVTCSYCGKANHNIEKCWKKAKDEEMA